MLCSNGKAPEVGQIFSNPNLAKTLRSLGENGKKGYYEGRIAEAIAEGMFLNQMDALCATGESNVMRCSVRSRPVQRRAHPAF